VLDLLCLLLRLICLPLLGLVLLLRRLFQLLLLRFRRYCRGWRLLFFLFLFHFDIKVFQFRLWAVITLFIFVILDDPARVGRGLIL
jgi:hypothetical protein